ncbi:MAG: lycopene cyclase family protein, partial [Bacteroidota bacterium]
MENLKAQHPYSNVGTSYDFIFIGLGASNSLILLSLIKEACVANKKIAIIEPELKNKNDKTYCFWADPNDSIVKDLKQIISYNYTSIEVNRSVLQNIQNQPYYYIKSIDLYNHTLDALLKLTIPIYRQAVVEVVCNDDDLYSIKTDCGEFESNYIFDSRPPQANQIGKDDIYLNQSFYGLHIRCKNEVFNASTFLMMDFNVDQDKYTQFLYTLPFSAHEALIELTRFGIEKIEIEYAKKILDNKLKNSYGDYEILSDEAGCIPMTTFINPYNKFNGVLNTGASANLIKPSTGYGFKNMYEFAIIVTERIKDENFKLFNQIALNKKKRFRFYDNLLLIILLLWPGEGYKIFTKLFKSQNIHRIFKFLDEKTSLSQEIKIFSTLPIIPFLRALYVYIRKLSWYRFALATIGVLIYFLFIFLPNDTAVNISYVAISIGLLLIGIPHGAVDHLLQKDKKIALLPFVLNYLFILLLYFILWQFLPLFSLLFFIVYSSFHFGESELEELGIKIVSITHYLKAILLGFSLLSFIIFTHFNEAIDIVSSING